MSLSKLLEIINALFMSFEMKENNRRDKNGQKRREKERNIDFVYRVSELKEKRRDNC